MYPVLVTSSLGVKLRAMLRGESMMRLLGRGGAAAYESVYDVALVPEKDLAVDGLDDEKLLLRVRSLRNIVASARSIPPCVCVYVYEGAVLKMGQWDVLVFPSGIKAAGVYIILFRQSKNVV